VHDRRAGARLLTERLIFTEGLPEGLQWAIWIADSEVMAFAAAHAVRLAGEARVFEFLRSHAPTDRVSVCVSTSGRRGLRPTAALLREQAAATSCHVALAETGHIAAHWIDAIVWGTAVDVECFLMLISPALAGSAGRRARHGVSAIVAA
jgi:anti-sigma regulatory factor (Ser/Thr protein kinase)